TTQLRKGVQYCCLIKDLIVQSDRLVHFSCHGHEQFLPAVHQNVLSESSSIGVWTLSTLKQLKIRLFPQVLDVCLDQCGQGTMSDVDQVTNRPDEAIALC